MQRHGDAALAVALGGLALFQIALLDVSQSARVAAAAAVLTFSAAAAVRVRMPLLLLGLLLVEGAAGSLLPKRLGDIEAIGLFVVLGIYSAAAHTDGRRKLAGAVLTVVFGFTAMATDPEGINVAAVFFFGLAFGAPWVAGRAIRHRRLREQRLEGERERAEAAVVDERARIARELHDVVAHAISVIVLQARGGRRVLDEDPADARDAFDVIERTGRQALDEMRRLLGMLRSPDERLAVVPQPGMARLPDLVATVRAAGLPVHMEVEGTPIELPPGVDLSAYRIVQEALTNALKHAGPARALVVIRYHDQELELEITDDGAGNGAESGSGHGLAGMRERVALYGGALETGRAAAGGYALRATLPLDPARA